MMPSPPLTAQGESPVMRIIDTLMQVAIIKMKALFFIKNFPSNRLGH